MRRWARRSYTHLWEDLPEQLDNARKSGGPVLLSTLVVVLDVGVAARVVEDDLPNLDILHVPPDVPQGHDANLDGQCGDLRPDGPAGVRTRALGEDVEVESDEDVVREDRENYGGGVKGVEFLGVDAAAIEASE